MRTQALGAGTGILDAAWVEHKDLRLLEKNSHDAQLQDPHQAKVQRARL